MATGQSTKKRKAAAKPGETAKGARARLSKNGSGTAAHQRTASAHQANGANGADLALQREIEQLLFRQSGLLDGKRWQDYIDLFTDDGHYWMPAAPEQTTGEGVPSIFYEDKNLMNVRMRRVQHPDAWSQRPLWGTNHVVSNVIVESENRKKGELVVRSRFHMMEFRRETSRHFRRIVRPSSGAHARWISDTVAARRHGQRPGAVRLRAADLGLRPESPEKRMNIASRTIAFLFDPAYPGRPWLRAGGCGGGQQRRRRRPGQSRIPEHAVGTRRRAGHRHPRRLQPGGETCGRQAGRPSRWN